MRIDLHIHTRRYSGCSSIDPSALLPRARAVGLDGIALTEHGIRWPDTEINRLKRDAGLREMLVLAGQEAACYSARGQFQGEFLVFGYPDSLGSNKSVEELARRVHSEGGVVIAAHPFKRDRSGTGYYGSGDGVVNLPIDGLEVAHPDYGPAERRAALAAMRASGLAGTGGSDAHHLNRVGRYVTLLPGPIENEVDFCEAVRNRQTRPVDGRIGTHSGDPL